MLAHKVEQRLARLLNVKIATYKDIAQVPNHDQSSLSPLDGP